MKILLVSDTMQLGFNIWLFLMASIGVFYVIAVANAKIKAAKEKEEDKKREIEENIKIQNEKEKEKRRNLNERNRAKNLHQKFLAKYSVDTNGDITAIIGKNEFNELLKKYQKQVIDKGKEFNQNYTHQFIKVGNYLNDKRINIKSIYDYIKTKSFIDPLNFKNFEDTFVNEIQAYNLLQYNSLNLIVSLIEDDQITFYKIYEKFDKLNIFNSNWENEMLVKLNDINTNISRLIYEIRGMSDNIVKSIGDLTYATQESNLLLDKKLTEINSTINSGNLLSAIQTYQLHKVNKQTKGLNP